MCQNCLIYRCWITNRTTFGVHGRTEGRVLMIQALFTNAQKICNNFAGVFRIHKYLNHRRENKRTAIWRTRPRMGFSVDVGKYMLCMCTYSICLCRHVRKLYQSRDVHRCEMYNWSTSIIWGVNHYVCSGFWVVSLCLSISFSFVTALCHIYGGIHIVHVFCVWCCLKDKYNNIFFGPRYNV